MGVMISKLYIIEEMLEGAVCYLSLLGMVLFCHLPQGMDRN
jgi:hypothetical protein